MDVGSHSISEDTLVALEVRCTSSAKAYLHVYREHPAFPAVVNSLEQLHRVVDHRDVALAVFEAARHG